MCPLVLNITAIDMVNIYIFQISNNVKIIQHTNAQLSWVFSSPLQPLS